MAINKYMYNVIGVALICFPSCVSVPPLFVVEFLHRVVDTFEDYFQGCSEIILKENYVIVYEVLQGSNP